MKLLVPSDQIGCIIGKGGQIVQNIRSETGAQIRILKDDHLPTCALSSDELVQVIYSLSFKVLVPFLSISMLSKIYSLLFPSSSSPSLVF